MNLFQTPSAQVSDGKVLERSPSRCSSALLNTKRILQAIFAGLIVVYVILCALPITQVDLWWQLTEGLRMLRSFHLPTMPATAFGFPAKPYIDEYAGYEVALALIYQLSGFKGIWIFFFTVYLLLVFLPSLAFGRTLPRVDVYSTLSIIIATLLFKFRFEQRPEFVGEVFLELLFLLLCRLKIEAISLQSCLFLFSLFVAWSNTHSTFVIGLFALSIWVGVELVLKADRTSFIALLRTTSLLLIITTSASLVNPYGIERLLFPFQQTADLGGIVLSAEMWPLSDFHSILGILVLAAVGLFLIAFLNSKTIPVWLVLFSLVSLYLTVRNIRFANVLAVSLLFVNACREGTTTTSQLRPFNLSISVKVICLIIFCTMAFLWDYLSLTTFYGDLRGEMASAKDQTFFYPSADGITQGVHPGFIPVLCGHGEGSYLSFPPDCPLHPILDSGMAHFSDTMKRYFLFAANDPLAFQMVIGHLDVQTIVIDRATFPWILGLSSSSDWTLVSCNKSGQLWERNRSERPSSISFADSRQVQAVIDEFIKLQQYRSAFCYSTFLKNSATSLSLLVHCHGAEWSDSLFNFTVAWVASLDEGEVRQFLKGDHQNDYPLADAILWARLGPGPYERYLVTANRTMEHSWQWKLVEARVHLIEGNRNRAEMAFDSIAPAPTTSIGYYSLWQDLKGAATAPATGCWQMWDGAARNFVTVTTGELNQRIEALKEASSR